MSITLSSVIARAVGIALLATPVSPSTTAFHELADNRATLVLRDDTHLSVTLYLNYIEALHRAIAPGRTAQEFARTYSALPLPQLRAALDRAHRRFVSGTRLSHANGDVVALTNWSWPDAARVQSLLQQQVMHTVVAPGEHAHESPTEVHADGNATKLVTSVTLRFPAEFERVLVVSYRPNQVWVDPTGASPRITF